MNDPRHRNQAGEAGFGLLEMTIASLLLGLVMAGMFTMLFRTQATFELQLAGMDIRQQARVSLDMMSTELRLAGYQMGNLTEPIPQAGANVLQLVGDIDDSAVAAPCDATYENAADGGAERVTYELSAGRLLRSVHCWNGAAWALEFNEQVAAVGLVGNQSLFRYFDEDGAELVAVGTELTAAQRAAIRQVTIDLDMLDAATPVGGEQPEFALSARVRLPNVS